MTEMSNAAKLRIAIAGIETVADMIAGSPFHLPHTAKALRDISKDIEAVAKDLEDKHGSD